MNSNFRGIVSYGTASSLTPSQIALSMNTKFKSKIDYNGDLKHSLQTKDHGKWVLLDGRSVDDLSAFQRAKAKLVGYCTNLPDAKKTYLSQQDPIGDIIFSNKKLITQANLPSVDLYGTTNVTGEHTHTYQQHNVPVQVDRDNDANVADDNSANTSNVSSAGNHSHTVTVQLGGSDEEFDVRPKTFCANLFIYLG
jgi:hypothetical protein